MIRADVHQYRVTSEERAGNPLKKIVFSLVLVICVVAALAYWLLFDNYQEIGETQVFRSGQLSAAELLRRVEQDKIRTVINLRGRNPNETWYRQERQALQKAGIRQLDISLNSTKLPVRARIKRVLSALKEEPRPILVHCKSGVDRSGLAGMLTLLLQEGVGLEQAASQVSLMKGVYRQGSIGRLFLRQYSLWLEQNHLTHTPKILDQYIDQDYVGSEGNFLFLVDHAKDFRVPLTADGVGRISLSGWAYDPGAEAPLTEIALMACGKVVATAKLGGSRKDVSQYFNNPEMEQSGWKLNATLAEPPASCCPLTFRLSGMSSGPWATPPLTNLCRPER